MSWYNFTTYIFSNTVTIVCIWVNHSVTEVFYWFWPQHFLKNFCWCLSLELLKILIWISWQKWLAFRSDKTYHILPCNIYLSRYLPTFVPWYQSWWLLWFAHKLLLPHDSTKNCKLVYHRCPRVVVFRGRWVLGTRPENLKKKNCTCQNTK